MNKNIMKSIKKIVLLLVAFISLLTFLVFANQEIEGKSNVNVEDTVGITPGKNEKTYTHIGRYILADNEGEKTYYLSQAQYDEIKGYLKEAAACSSGSKEWWNCSNHGADGWAKLVEFGVFTYDDYKNHKRSDFQNNYLTKVKVTDIFDLEVKSQCTIGTLMSYLNNTSSNANYILKQFSSVFCIKHNNAIPSWTDSWGEYKDFSTLNRVTHKYDLTSRALTGGDTATADDSNTTDYKEDANSREVVTKSNIKYFLTNEDMEDLHSIYNGYSTYKTNVFIYALSFSQKLSPAPGYLDGNYSKERAQRAIWGVVGAEAEDFQNDALYKAGKSVDALEEQVAAHGDNPKVSKRDGDAYKVTSGTAINGAECVGDGDYEPTGTTIYKNSSNELIYRIGPFKMSDYAYVNNSNAQSFSGSQVTVDQSLVGGIVYGEIVLNGGTKIPIGYNEKNGDSGTSFTRTDGKNNAKIVYVDANGNSTSKGDYSRSGDYFNAPSDYQYPWPKSVFYIDVPKSECGSATNLTGINFEYRQTYTEGNGWIITGKYVEAVWKNIGDTTGCTTFSASCAHDTYSKTVSSYTSCPVTIDWKHDYTDGCNKDKDGVSHCPGHTCSGSATGTCSHGYTKCVKFSWDNTKAEVELAQPFVAVHDACTKVDTYTKTNSLNVRLTTNVTIDKYITKVEHTIADESFVDSDNYSIYDSAFDSEFSNTNRAGKTDSAKKSDSVKLERGDKLTYNLVLKNSSNKKVQVQIKDILPNYCKLESISVGTVAAYTNTDGEGTYDNNKWFITQWVEIDANDTEIVTVTLIATASDATIQNKNTATLVSGNAGRRIGDGITKDDDKINYVRVEDSKGAVVNLAQISGTTIDKVLKSEEYYTVKSYNVAIDKYITEVKHVTTNEITYQRDKLSYEKDRGVNGYTCSQEFNDRDTYNDDTKESSLTISGKINNKKYSNPIYVEYGDKVTYNIDIQNTWYANAKEIDHDADGFSVAGVKSVPYYTPNYLYVGVTDVLPECYQESSLEVKYYIYDVKYGNDVNGEEYLVETQTFKPKVTKNSNGTYKFNLKDLYINPNSEATLEVSFIVNSNQTDYKFENSVSLDSNNVNKLGIKGGTGYGKGLSYDVRNINNYYVYNTPNNGDAKLRIWSADYFLLNDYNAKMDKFISDYNESMLHKNIAKDFEEYYATDLSDRPNKSDDYKFKNPVSAEKTEIVKYTLRVFNEAVDEIKVSTGDLDYYKPATKVRVSSIKDTLEEGLTLINKDKIVATIYNASGAATISNIPVTTVDQGNNVYDFNIPNKWNNKFTMVEPGGYIEYVIDVRIDKSNMHLLNIENKAEINVLTDINNISSVDSTSGKAPTAKDHTRKVTERNISNQKYSKDYIRLKDLIISGKVWLDFDKDGYMSEYNGLSSLKAGDTSNVNSERVMEGIVVKLYRTSNGKETGELIRTAVTDRNGLFTFARLDNDPSNYRTGLDQRIDKATNKDANKNYKSNSKYIEYYVEYEYDGVLYKSTDIYSGTENLNANGSMKEKYDVDSNATEFISDRENFNKKYQFISYDVAYPTAKDGKTANLSQKTALSFDKQPHESYLIVDHSRLMKSRSFVLTDTQKTDFLWIFNYPYTNSSGNKDIRYPETEYLKYINLGLEEREEADIALTKDVYEVKTTINGEEMTYAYNQNMGINGQMKNGSHQGNYEIANPYGLTLYESDYKYRHTDYENRKVEEYKGKESELNVEITYRIRVNNIANAADLREYVTENGKTKLKEIDVKLNSRIHEITDLYDMNFMKYNDNPNETINVKEKDDNNQLKNKAIKIAEAWCYDKNGDKVELKLSNKSKYSSKANNFTSDGYNTMYITGMDNVLIEESNSLDIYVKYVVDKNDESIDGQPANALKIAENIVGKANSKGQENIAQINAYSIWYEDGKPTSMVDKDSNVGNIGEKNSNKEMTSADDSEYYEDTVYKTGIDITALNSPNEPPTGEGELIRTITGKVWDDSRSQSVEKDGYTQYLANGIYDKKDASMGEAKINQNVEENYKNDKTGNKETEDILVRNAKAEYVEIVEIAGVYYEEKLKGTPWAPVQSIRTDAEGKYTLNGFIPGYYIVRYSYGDTTENDDMIIFNGQDYKSTMYTGVADTEKDDDKIIAEMQKATRSDARDDEIRRLEVIAYSETMVNKKAEVLKGIANGRVARTGDEVNSASQYEELINNTSMFADTVKFYVKPEKLKELTKPENTQILSYNGLTGKIIYEYLYDLEFEDTSIPTREYNIQNIDFGIEYRPEVQISLYKEISRIKLVTADDNVLVDLALETVDLGDGNAQVSRIIEEDSKGLDYTQFVSNDYKYLEPSKLTSEDYQGIVFVNVDKEILHGSSIMLEYKFTAENNSETDMISKNLDSIRYRENDAAKALNQYIAYVEKDGTGRLYKFDRTANKFFIQDPFTSVGELKENVYTAAGTARNALYDEYYKRDEYGSICRTKELKTYDKTKSDSEQSDDIYYGRYMSKLYYLGEVGTEDVISSLKFDRILDYVDTELIFEKTEDNESAKDKLWDTYTDNALKSTYVKEKNYSLIDVLSGRLALVNPQKEAYVRYDENNQVESNLVVSVDDRVSDAQSDVINNGLSKFLKPYIEDNKDASRGTIFLEVSKVVSQETETDSMAFENMAEVIQFTTQTGRRTNYATTIGNANCSIDEFEEAKKEPDTSATETITFIPPTGLLKQKQMLANMRDAAEVGVNVLSVFGLVAGPILVIIVIVVLTKYIYKKRRIK